MTEKPRRRDESIISKQMMAQILIMGRWLTVVSFVYLKAPFFKNLFGSEEQHLTGYFVLFIISACLTDLMSVMTVSEFLKDWMKIPVS